MSGAALVASIPAPGVRDITLGPFDIRLYALCLLAGMAAAVWLSMRRWKAVGGDPDLVLEVALWSVLAGLDRRPALPRHHELRRARRPVVRARSRSGRAASGSGAACSSACWPGAYVTHRRGASVLLMMDAAAPGILIAQGIGRLGNYFNQELFGGPSDLPWGLEVDLAHRPDKHIDDPTFHPTFLYEMLWNFGGAALIIWLGHRFRLRAPGVFCLYVVIYSLGRIFWEQLRVDPSKMFLGQRLNFYVALALSWARSWPSCGRVRRGPETPTRPAAELPRTPGGARVPARRVGPRSAASGPSS